MQRRWLATIASLGLVALFLWRSQFATTAGRTVLWLVCALLLVVAGGLAAGMRWARWFGLVAGVVLALLISFGLAAGYFFSLFGDQALDFRTALPFLAGIGCASALAVLLTKAPD